MDVYAPGADSVSSAEDETGGALHAYWRHFVHVPKDTVHALKNVGEVPARFLSWSLPGLAEAFFAESDGASRRGPQSLEDVVAIAARHRIRAMF